MGSNPKRKVKIIPGLAYDKTGGNETYPKENNEELVVQFANGPRYAKDKDNNEIYPKDAQLNDKFIPSFYALDKNNDPIFPKTKDGDEFYVEDEYGSSVVYADGKLLPRYARTKYSEVYPLEFLGAGLYREIVLNNKYIKNTANQEFYPLDEYGNEFTIQIKSNNQLNVQATFPNFYPITNDGYVILSNVNGEPYFIPKTIPEVKEDNIVGKLFRAQNGFRDFFTDVELTSRECRSAKRKYNYFPIGASEPTEWIPEALMSEQQTSSWWYWLFILLSVILGVVVVPILYGMM